MSLSTSALGALIRTKMLAKPQLGPALQALHVGGEPTLAEMCDAIAEAVVEHVMAAAVVTVTGTATGVTAGAAAAPVTGTGGIT